MVRVSTFFRQAGLALAVVAVLGAVAPSVIPAATGPEPVDINTASADELMALPGVGPAIAQRIIEYREQSGPFSRPVELMNVKGIGEKTFDRLKDRITVTPDPRK